MKRTLLLMTLAIVLSAGLAIVLSSARAQGLPWEGSVLPTSTLLLSVISKFLEVGKLLLWTPWRFWAE